MFWSALTALLPGLPPSHMSVTCGMIQDLCHALQNIKLVALAKLLGTNNLKKFVLSTVKPHGVGPQWLAQQGSRQHHILLL